MLRLITLLQLCKPLHMILDNTGSAKHCSWDYLYSSSTGICSSAMGQILPFSTLFKWLFLAVQDRPSIAFHLCKRVGLAPFIQFNSRKVSPEVFWAEFRFQETKELVSSYWVLQHLIHGETPSFHTLLTRFFAAWREKGKNRWNVHFCLLSEQLLPFLLSSKGRKIIRRGDGVFFLKILQKYKLANNIQKEAIKTKAIIKATVLSGATYMAKWDSEWYDFQSNFW